MEKSIAHALKMKSKLTAQLLATVGILAIGAAQAQVTYFDKVPTPAEIKKALAERNAAQPTQEAPAATPNVAQPRTRSIEWNHAPISPAAQAAVKPTVAEMAKAAPAVALPVNFAAGTAKISPASIAYIESMVAVLNLDPTIKIVIEGHTDSGGRAQQNLLLSWDRAMSVYRLMIEKYGIDPSRLQPVGKGSAEPMDQTAPLDPRNRRVQFRIVG